MKKIVIPFLFEGYLILALDIEWIKVFDGMPKFDVLIKDGKLCIVSQGVMKNE